MANLQEYARNTEMLSNEVGDLNTLLQQGVALSRQYSEEYRRLTANQVSATDALRKLVDQYQKGAQFSKENSQALQGWLRDSQKVTKQTAELTKVLEAHNFAAASVTDKFKMMGEKVGSLTRSLGGLTIPIAAVGLGYRDLDRHLLAYNRTQIESAAISRNYGESLKSIREAQIKARSATTLSQQDFAELNKMFKEMQVGVPKSAGAVVRFAQDLQSRFGYSVEVAKQKTQELLSLQGRFDQFIQIKDGHGRCHDLNEHEYHFRITKLIVHREAIDEESIDAVHFFHTQENGEQRDNHKWPFNGIF
jgi:DNA repair ATPase RecN